MPVLENLPYADFSMGPDSAPAQTRSSALPLTRTSASCTYAGPDAPSNSSIAARDGSLLHARGLQAPMTIVPMTTNARSEFPEILPWLMNWMDAMIFPLNTTMPLRRPGGFGCEVNEPDSLPVSHVRITLIVLAISLIVQTRRHASPQLPRSRRLTV